MGLDAVVYCRCYEDGKLRALPPTECRIDRSGALEATTSDIEEQGRVYLWRTDACEHKDGVLIHRYLGNVAMIAFIRRKLESASDRFSLLLSRVVYDGIHAGDYVDASLIARLAVEVDAISAVASEDLEEERHLETFQRQLRELVEVARDFGKPIAF